MYIPFHTSSIHVSDQLIVFHLCRQISGRSSSFYGNGWSDRSPFWGLGEEIVMEQEEWFSSAIELTIFLIKTDEILKYDVYKKFENFQFYRPLVRKVL